MLITYHFSWTSNHISYRFPCCPFATASTLGLKYLSCWWAFFYSRSFKRVQIDLFGWVKKEGRSCSYRLSHLTRTLLRLVFFFFCGLFFFNKWFVDLAFGGLCLRTEPSLPCPHNHRDKSAHSLFTIITRTLPSFGVTSKKNQA